MTAAAERWQERLQHDLDQLHNVVRAHDAVHPERDVCGGIGGCVLMQTEHEVRTEVTDRLTEGARHGFRLRLSVAAS